VASKRAEEVESESVQKERIKINKHTIKWQKKWMNKKIVQIRHL
jgi:CHASE3 domain sensor protein